MKERGIFQNAIEIHDQGERNAYLDRVCGNDKELRNRVEILLRSSLKLGDFLESPILGESPVVRERDDKANAPLDSTIVMPLQTDIPIRDRLPFLTKCDRPDAIGCLGHYDVLEVLGEGGFGIVMKARDTKLQRIVAIKTLQPHLAKTSPPRKRFLREARAGAAIRHQNVVGVYSVDELPIPYLVMEYIHGPTLQDKIDTAGPLELDEILPIARQLANGLHAAHSSGLIHRDIKPSNILLEPGTEQRAIITDFGLARTVDDASLTQSASLTGTPMFMSPEQAQGLPVDARSDLFSLGSVLYVTVSGRPPFRASSTMAILKRVVEATPRPIQQIIPEAPDWLCRIIEKLMAKRPEDRFQSARELSDLLSQCQADLIQYQKVRSETISKINPKVITPTVTGSGSEAIVPANRKSLWIGLSAFAAISIFLAFVLMPPLKPKPSADSVIPPNPLAPPGDNANSDSPPAPPAPPGTSKLGSTQTQTVETQQTQPETQPTESLWTAIVGDTGLQPAIVPFDAEAAQKYQRIWAETKGLPVEFTNRVGITFRLIPAGEFEMGTSQLEVERNLAWAGNDEFWQENVRSEAPRHRVAITAPFYLATTEVTQGQYEEIKGSNPSYYSKTGPGRENVADVDPKFLPVEKTSWLDAVDFCQMLSIRDGLLSLTDAHNLTGSNPLGSNSYHLPTEAQWEFASRAGTSTRFYTGDSIDGLSSYGHYGNKLGRPSSVGQLKSNAFGLYDMSGNVNEWTHDIWTLDYFSELAKSALSINPAGPATNSNMRVTKGGDFYWSENELRFSERYGNPLDIVPSLAVGIRVALPASAVSKLADSNAVSPAVNDFLESHSLPFAKLQSWLSALPKGYTPSVISLRHGGEGLLFDVVAIRGRMNLP